MQHQRAECWQRRRYSARVGVAAAEGCSGQGGRVGFFLQQHTPCWASQRGPLRSQLRRRYCSDTHSAAGQDLRREDWSMFYGQTSGRAKMRRPSTRCATLHASRLKMTSLNKYGREYGGLRPCQLSSSSQRAAASSRSWRKKSDHQPGTDHPTAQRRGARCHPLLPQWDGPLRGASSARYRWGHRSRTMAAAVFP